MPPRRQPADLTFEHRMTNLETNMTYLEKRLKYLLGGTGLTLVIIVGFAFYFGQLLGTLNTTASKSSAKVDSIYQAVLEGPNALQPRTSVIESKLTSIDKTQTEMSKTLTDLNTPRGRGHLSAIRDEPTPTPTPKK